MSEIKVIPQQTEPEFDLMYFLEVCGEKRIQHDLMEKLESAWMDWKDRVHAYKLVPPTAVDEEGFLLVYLTKGVEDAVEEAWQEAPDSGMFFHNLAITLVMSAAGSLVPEMAEGCAPLPRPGEAVLEIFEQMDLEWNPVIGSLNRQYAVYTPMPYRGGCEICMQSDTCPNSTLRGE